MEDRIAYWIDQVFEAVLKQNGIFPNSDLEELCDDFQNGGEDVPEDVEVEKDKELELELDVAEGFSDEDDGGEEFEKEHFKQVVVIDKLDKKNVSDDIDSESEMNIHKMNEKCEVADDKYVTLIVNDLPVTARKDIDSKTTLCHYCQQNRLQHPEYVVTLWNQYEDEWRLFRARFTLNGKRVVGSGTTPKKAEQAAARKYLNNNFISGEIPLQAEIHIPRKKKTVPPSKRRKEKKRLQEFLAKKDAAREAGKRKREESEDRSEIIHDKYEGVGRLTGEQSLQLSLPSESEGKEQAHSPQIPIISEVDDTKEFDPGMMVYFDLERSTGSEASEIIQLAYCAQSCSGISHIYPKGNIDPVCARLSHKIYKKGNDLVRLGEILPSMQLEKACKEFLTFLRKLAALKGSKPVLVCHGTDTITLFNNMALVHLDEELSEAILGAVNFLQVISDDDDYPHDTSSKSLTKIDPQKPNLSETVLGKDFDIEELGAAHDALYDSELLRRVVEGYCGGRRTMQQMVETYMCSGENSRRDARVHLSKRKSRKKRFDQSKFYTFFGWEDGFM